MSTPAIVCIDLETTGLDYDKCCILEVGIVVADADAMPIWSEAWMVEPLTNLSEVGEFVQDMHTRNGLWDDLKDPAKRNYLLGEAEQDILDWLDTLLLEPGKFPMFGSSIGFDRRFLSIHMPRLEAWFHYRNIDMSTIKEAARMWRPDLKWKPPATKAHRSVDDCESTLDEARYYKTQIFDQSSASPK